MIQPRRTQLTYEYYARKDFEEEKRIILQMVTQDGSFLLHASKEMKADRDVVLAAIRSRPSPSVFLSASEHFRAEKGFVLEVVSIQGALLEHVSTELKADRDVVKVAVGSDPLALRHASEELRADKDLVIAVVSMAGLVLQYASAGMQASKEVVLVAVSQDGRSLEYAGENCKADKDIVLTAVRMSGSMLQHAGSALQADKEVVLAAVGQDGCSLIHASAGLRADKEVVLAAVRSSGVMLQHADTSLRAGKEVVLAAVRQDGRAFQYAAEELQVDKDVVLTAMGSDQNPYHAASRWLSADKDVALLRERAGGGMGFLDFKAMGVTQLQFRRAQASPLAVAGQPRNTAALTVSLSFLSGDRDFYVAKTQLLSGDEFTSKVEARPYTDLSTLAATLLEGFQAHSKAADSTHVFITFLRSDGDSLPVTVWDHDRHLAEFLETESERELERTRMRQLQRERAATQREDKPARRQAANDAFPRTHLRYPRYLLQPESAF